MRIPLLLAATLKKMVKNLFINKKNSRYLLLFVNMKNFSFSTEQKREARTAKSWIGNFLAFPLTPLLRFLFSSNRVVVKWIVNRREGKICNLNLGNSSNRKNEAESFSSPQSGRPHSRKSWSVIVIHYATKCFL